MTLVHESKRACIGAMVPLDKKLENFVTNLLPLLPQSTANVIQRNRSAQTAHYWKNINNEILLKKKTLKISSPDDNDVKMTQQLSKIVWKSKSRHFFSVNDTKSAAECTVTIYRYKTIWANANTGEIQLHTWKSISPYL